MSDDDGKTAGSMCH